MHAVVIDVKIEQGREDEGVAYLHSHVLPSRKGAPGLLSGYWLAATDGRGQTVLVFADQEAARSTADGIANAPRADFASIGNIDIREVVAHL